jgi:hypothetical protein
MALQKMNKGDVNAYKTATGKMLSWMKRYPLLNNKWGPFFEDIPGWSDTQINAVTFARFILEHKELFPTWKKDVRSILDWVYQRLGNEQWKQYGVKVVNEQTAYMTPGNSHTSRQAAAELLYALHSGDTTNKELAIRQLHWATYMVDRDGKNCYPRDEVWLTDGYGDYIRHYLNAMAAMPELAPANSNHILHSTSVVAQADYAPNFNKRLVPEVKADEQNSVAIFYRTYDAAATETIRMTSKPVKITVSDKAINEANSLTNDGWMWQPLSKGGVLKIRHTGGTIVKVFIQ